MFCLYLRSTSVHFSHTLSKWSTVVYTVSDLLSASTYSIIVPIIGCQDKHTFTEVFWSSKAWLYLSLTLSMTTSTILRFSIFVVIVLVSYLCLWCSLNSTIFLIFSVMTRGRPKTRETIAFGSTSDPITKKTFELDGPVNGDSYESSCWGEQLSK